MQIKEIIQDKREQSKIPAYLLQWNYNSKFHEVNRNFLTTFSLVYNTKCAPIHPSNKKNFNAL